MSTKKDYVYKETSKITKFIDSINFKTQNLTQSSCYDMATVSYKIQLCTIPSHGSFPMGVPWE